MVVPATNNPPPTPEQTEPTVQQIKADVVFVIEGTANLGAYFNNLKTSYIIPTVEYYNGGPIAETDFGGDYGGALYGLIVFQTADCAPEPATLCIAPTSSAHVFLTWLDRLKFVGGAGHSCSHIAEGLSSALQLFDDFQKVREQTPNLQKQCILVCNSPPFLMPSIESITYTGHTAEQLAGIMGERGIDFSIMSPRKLPVLQRLYEKGLGTSQDQSHKDYTTDPRHLILLKGFELKERVANVEGKDSGVKLTGFDPEAKPVHPASKAQAPTTNTGAPVTKPTGSPARSTVPTGPSVTGSPQNTKPRSSPGIILASPPNKPQTSSTGPTQGQPQGGSTLSYPQAPQQPQPPPPTRQEPYGQQPQPQVRPQAPQVRPQMTVSSQQPMTSGLLRPSAPAVTTTTPLSHLPAQQRVPTPPPSSKPAPAGPPKGAQQMAAHIMKEAIARARQPSPNVTVQPWRQNEPRNVTGGPARMPGVSPPTSQQQGPWQPQAPNKPQNPPQLPTSTSLAQSMAPPLQISTISTSQPPNMNPGMIPSMNQAPRAMQQAPPQQQFPVSQPQSQTMQTSVQQAPRPTPAPVQMQPQQGGNQTRVPIWTGALEWQEVPPKNSPNDLPQKVNRSLACQVSIQPGESLQADKWPSKLIMQLIPQQLLVSLGSLFRNSRTVGFHFSNNDQDALRALYRVMAGGFAGCVHFPHVTQCEVRVLMLLYSAKKRAFMGLIPHDQTSFVNGIRMVITNHKKAQQQKAIQRMQQQQQQQQQQLSGGMGVVQQPNQGQMQPNTGQMQPNQGQMQPNQGQMQPNQGQMQPNTGQMQPNQGQMQFPPQQQPQAPSSAPQQYGNHGNMAGGGNMMSGGPAVSTSSSNMNQVPTSAHPVNPHPPVATIDKERQQNLLKIQQLQQTLEMAQKKQQQLNQQQQLMEQQRQQQIQQRLQQQQTNQQLRNLLLNQQQQQQMSQQMHNPNLGSQWTGQQQIHPPGPMMQQLPPHPPQPQQPMGGLQPNLLEDPNLHDLLN